MPSFRKLFLPLLCLAMAGAHMELMAAEKAPEAEKKADFLKRKEEKKGKEKDKAKGKGKKEEKPEKKSEEPPKTAGNDKESGGGKGKLSIPLVPGHDSKGLKIPYRDTQGKLQMLFIIGVATKLDEDNVRLSETSVETYNEDGSPEMEIELPVSVLNLQTRVITSQTKTKISRSDFELTGDGVEFNTETKEGKLVGNVQMIIYDLKTETDTKEDEQKADAPPEKPNE